MRNDPDWKRLQNDYEESRFLDAYRASESYWSLTEIPEDWDIRNLIFAGRLAARLGGGSTMRALYAEAGRRDPGHPAVVVYGKDALGRPALNLTCYANTNSFVV